MAKLAFLLLALFIIVAAGVAAVHEPLRASAQQGLCNMTQNDLEACRPAITGPKPAPQPSDLCCGALQHADLNCLCSYKNSMWLKFLKIDSELAMELPKECKMTPPATC